LHSNFYLCNEGEFIYLFTYLYSNFYLCNEDIVVLSDLFDLVRPARHAGLPDMLFANWGHIRVNYLIFSKWDCMKLGISIQEQEMKQRDHTEGPHGDAELGNFWELNWRLYILNSPSNFEIRVY
jgi:hypothetical protein